MCCIELPSNFAESKKNNFPVLRGGRVCLGQPARLGNDGRIPFFVFLAHAAVTPFAQQSGTDLHTEDKNRQTGRVTVDASGRRVQ